MGNVFSGINNPGLDFGQLTEAEAQIVRDLGALTFAQGDILYVNSSGELTNLAIGAENEILSVSAGGIPEWASAGAGSGDFLADGSVPMTGDFNLDGNNIDNGGVIFLIEQAEADADVAGSGQIWVDTATPNVLMFTDDAGTDFTIAHNATTSFPSLVTIQSLTVTLADAGADAIFGWDDTAGAYENLTSAEVFAVLGITSTASELNILDGATLTVTELNYVDGVTSAIQTQLDAKAPLDSPVFTTAVTLPVGLTGVIRADSGVVSVDSDVTDIVTAADSTTAGKVELATTAETETGTDATRAVTPDGLHDMTTLSGAAWFLDEDNMASDSAVKVPSQQSVKAYADTMLPKAGGTMTGNITLGENTSIALDPAGSADGKYSGITIAGTAGATLAFGDLVYLAAADSRWELADSDAVGTAGPVLLGMCVLAAASDGDATVILLQGNIRADAAFPALTISAPAYVGTTAGDIQTSAPSGDNDVVRIVGHALTADELYFNPSTDWVVLVV